jgi:transcriptional regulator with XRE-family HTH domain
MQHRKVQETDSLFRYLQAHVGEWPHAADLYVGRQVAAVRVQSDVTQAELARAVRISPQQLQKYENGKNRVSASMLFEIATFLGVPVSRFFEGLPGNEKQEGEAALLPADERITFIASAEGRRLIKGVMQLYPRMRRRVSSLIAALGEELSALDGGRGCQPPETDNGRGGTRDTTRELQTVFASDDADRGRA